MNHELNIEVVHWHINTSWHCCGCGASPLCDHTAHHSAARGPLVGHRGCGGDLGWVLVGCERGVGSGGHRRCSNSCTPQSSACTGVQGWAPGWVQGRVEDWEEHPDGETAWGGSAGHPRGETGTGALRGSQRAGSTVVPGFGGVVRESGCVGQMVGGRSSWCRGQSSVPVSHPSATVFA